MRRQIRGARGAVRIVAILAVVAAGLLLDSRSPQAGTILEPHISASVDVAAAAAGSGVGVRVACEIDGHPADFVTAVLETADYESLSSTGVQLADATDAWMQLIIPPETPAGDYSVWFLCAWSDTGGTSTRVPFTVTGDAPVAPPPALIDARTTPLSGPPGTPITTQVACTAPDGTPATDVRSVLAATGLVVSAIDDAIRPLDPSGAGTVAVEAPEHPQGFDLRVFTTCYQQGLALASHSEVFDLEVTATPPTTLPVDPGGTPPAVVATPSFTG